MAYGSRSPFSNYYTNEKAIRRKAPPTTTTVFILVIIGSPIVIAFPHRPYLHGYAILYSGTLIQIAKSVCAVRKAFTGWVVLKIGVPFGVLSIRVPYYIWDLEREPNLENYPDVCNSSGPVSSVRAKEKAAASF